METLSIHTYIICSLLIYFLVGISCYLFDRKVGVGLQKKKYNLMHEVPLAEGEEFGFLFNRKLSVKFAWAGMVAAVTSVMLVVFFETNPVIEVFTWFFDAFMVTAGMLVGPFAWKIVQGREKIIEKIDDVHESIKDGSLQQGVRDGLNEVVGDLKGVGGAVVGGVVGVANDASEAVTGKRRFGKDPVPVNPESSVPDEDPTEEELRRHVDKFTKRGGGQ